MNIVTGGTGLLGSHLLYDLSKNEGRIKAMFRDQGRIELVKEIFQFYSPDSWESQFIKIEWVKGDVLDLPFLNEFIEPDSVVYHCAAFVSFDHKFFNKLMSVNRAGTENIVNVCLAKNVKKLCHVSSTAAIVGDGTTHVTEETKWKKTPETSCYSISKYSSEREVWRGMEEGLNAVIVNPCVILGAGSWNDSSLTIFRTVKKGLKYYPPGTNATVDARDVVRIMIELVKHDIRNERFLCIGSNQSFKELMETIANELGVRAPSKELKRWQANVARVLLGIGSIFTGHRPAMTKETINNLYGDRDYSNEKIKSALGYEFYTLEEQVRNAIRGQIQSKNS